MYNGGTHEGGYEAKLAQTKGLENKGVRVKTVNHKNQLTKTESQKEEIPRVPAKGRSNNIP